MNRASLYIFLLCCNPLKLVFSLGYQNDRGLLPAFGQTAPLVGCRMKKSEQIVAVARKGTVSAVGMLFADQPCFDEVLDGSPCGFLRDAEILGNPFHAGPGLTHHITAVIQIDVDELRSMGKLVISVQFFKVRQSDHLLIAVRTGVLCFCETFSSLMTVPPEALGCWGDGPGSGNALSTAARIVSLPA